MGLVLLYQIRFQCEGFCLAVGHDEFDLADLPHHQGDARAVILRILEVTPNPVPEGLGFTDIENAVVLIAHQITTRLRGHILEPEFEAFGFLDQGQGTRHQPPYCQPVPLSSRAAPSRWRVAVFTSPTNTV